MTSDVKLREALEVIAEGGCECVGEHHPKELCAGCIARDALAAAPSAEPAPPETTLARDLLERIGLQNGRIDAPEEDVDRMESSATAKVVWHQYEFGAPVLVTMDDGQEFAGYLTTLPDLSDPDLDGVIHLPEVDEGTSLWLTVADMALLDECERIEIGRAAPPAETGEGWKTLCVECGPNVPIDEDFCCTTCGASAVGQWLESLATPVDPPTGPMDKLRESWKHSLPVDPPTGETRERCGGTGEVYLGSYPAAGEIHEATISCLGCPDCSGRCDDPDDCPTYGVGTLLVEGREPYFVLTTGREEGVTDVVPVDVWLTALPSGTYRIVRDPTGDAPGGET